MATEQKSGDTGTPSSSPPTAAGDAEIDRMLSDFGNYLDDNTSTAATTTSNDDSSNQDKNDNNPSIYPAASTSVSATPSESKTTTATTTSNNSNQPDQEASSQSEQPPQPSTETTEASGDEFFKPYQSTAVDSLHDMFPTISIERLEAILEAHQGSVERTANYLILEASGSSSNDDGDTNHGVDAGESAGRGNEEGDGGRGGVEDDEAFARRLQRELNVESAGNDVTGESERGNVNGGRVDQNSMQSDEILARQLAGLDVNGGNTTATTASAYDYDFSGRRRRNRGIGVGEGDDWRAAVSIQRPLDSEESAEANTFRRKEVDEVVEFIRDGLAEEVKVEVRERGLADTQGYRDGVEWGISGVELVGFSVPHNGILVSRIGNSVKVGIRDVLMEVRIARWQYKREGWLKFSDSGKAWVVASGVGASLRVGQGGYVEPGIGNVEGTIKMKTTDSTADWLYNAISTMTKSVMSGWIADVVGNALKRAVLERMHLWELAQQQKRAEKTEESDQGPASSRNGTENHEETLVAELQE